MVTLAFLAVVEGFAEVILQLVAELCDKAAHDLGIASEFG